MAFLESTSGANFSVAQTVSATANATNIFDVTGAGIGTIPTRMIGAGGSNTSIGIDIGAGDGMFVPQVLITNANTVAGTGGGTVQFTLQAAPDNGSGTAGTYTILYTSPTFIGTTISTTFSHLFNVPPIVPGQSLPRFYQLVYTVSGTLSAIFNASLTANAPTVRDATLYGNNFLDL